MGKGGAKRHRKVCPGLSAHAQNLAVSISEVVFKLSRGLAQLRQCVLGDDAYIKQILPSERGLVLGFSEKMLHTFKFLVALKRANCNVKITFTTYVAKVNPMLHPKNEPASTLRLNINSPCLHL